MAQFFPSLDKIRELKVRPEPGEWHLLNFLSETLDNTFEIYFNPFLNGDRPDIIIMRKEGGILIIEVKDWDLKHYELNERRKWKVKGQPKAFLKSPIDQVLQYKENLYNLHIENLLEKKIKNFKYWSIVSCAMYFHNETVKSISDFLIEPYKDDDKYQNFLKHNIDFLGHDNLNKKDFFGLLWKRYLISKFDKSKYFTDDLYDSFKRFFKPTTHTIEDGKQIKYNSQQQELILSASVELLLKGVVGSGKTTVLAVRAVNAHKRTHGKILILTYNITLKNYVHDKISQVREHFEWDNFYITNYHNFITAEFNNLGIEIKVPENFSQFTEEQKSTYFEQNYYSNQNIFDDYHDKTERYSAIFIDEIQDYKIGWMKMIKNNFLAIGGEYVLFGDEKQNIYDNEIEEKELKTNISDQRRKRKMTISNSFGDKIGGIALDFQKQLLIGKYDIDKLSTSQLTIGGVTKYLFIDKSTGVDGILEQIQKISLQLGEHPNDITILGFTIKLLRQYDCYYRYKTGEKTKTMFETQEVWNKLFLDNNGQTVIVKAGLNLFSKSKLRDDDDKKTTLAILMCIYSLLKQYNLDSFKVRLNEILQKHTIMMERFEEWFNDEGLAKLIKDGYNYQFAERIKAVRDNKKLHFWFNSGTVKLSTIHSFKGWEASTLFLVIEEKYESGDFKMSFPELIYTGLTRSKENLIVLNYGNQEFDNDLNRIFKIRE